MTKDEATIIYFELINRLYSINYSNLRIYEQRKQKFENEGFKFGAPYGKMPSWVDSKMEDINRFKADFFARYNEANEKNHERFILIDNNLERAKEWLLYVYNTCYEKECSFEDVFDGFLCKSPDLLELLYMFEMKPCITNSPAVLHLVSGYTSYLECLFEKTVTSSMLDIVDQLSNDFNSNGTPSLYSGIIRKDNVLKISAEKIKARRQYIESVKKQLKEIKPQKYSGEAYTHEMSSNKCKSLDVFWGQIESRLKSANTDVIKSISDKIVEGAMDFLTGTPKPVKPTVNEIYVTDLEMSYIDYLIEMLEFGLASLNENKSEKKEDKQKGETQ